MLAYEIEIDGKRYVTAGVDDWSILSLHITGSRAEQDSSVQNDYVELSVGGLSTPNEESVRHHFRWVNAPLDIGSAITIRIVDVQAVDEPKNRYRSDSKVQENPFTSEEWREMRYKDFLDLKAEFEPNTIG